MACDSAHSGGATVNQNGMVSMHIEAQQKKGLESKFEPYSVFHAGIVEMFLPIETVSEANGGKKRTVWKKGKKSARAEWWTEAATRHKRQKGIVALYLRRHKEHLRLPCTITLTRYAPLKLDRWDNLPMSMKWILDAVCEEITGDYRPGRADASEEIEVCYKQVQSNNYAVAVSIKFV